MTALRREETMAYGRYYDVVLNLLKGTSPDLAPIPGHRLDWFGLGAVLELYNQTAGAERVAFVQALGQLVEEETDPVVLAQLVYFITSLDLSQLEPSVAKLRARPDASAELVQAAVADYFSYRQLRRGAAHQTM